MEKNSIKKVFGFLIIVIALSVVGIEFILSILNSYGRQMERRTINFRKVRAIDNSDEAFEKKLVKLDAHGMITAKTILYRILRRKSETESAPQVRTGGQRGQQPATQQGTSGGGGEQPSAAQPAENTAQPEAQTPAASVSDALKTELATLFKKNYNPNDDEVNKFKSNIDGLAGDEHANLLKGFIAAKVRIDQILRLDNELLKSITEFFAVLTDAQKKLFINEIFGARFAEFKADGLQKAKAIVEYANSEEAKNLKFKLTDDKFILLVSIYGHDDDNIRSALKYLVEKEIKDQHRMRFTEKTTYKMASWIITAIYLLALVMFILRFDLSRAFIMLFGIVKLFFLFTVPIIFLGGVTVLIVILSIIAIILSFISMYIVDLRLKEKQS